MLFAACCYATLPPVEIRHAPPFFFAAEFVDAISLTLLLRHYAIFMPRRFFFSYAFVCHAAITRCHRTTTRLRYATPAHSTLIFITPPYAYFYAIRLLLLMLIFAALFLLYAYADCYAAAACVTATAKALLMLATPY